MYSDLGYVEMTKKLWVSKEQVITILTRQTNEESSISSHFLQKSEYQLDVFLFLWPWQDTRGSNLGKEEASVLAPSLKV